MSEQITLIAKLKDELSGPIKHTGDEVKEFDKKLAMAAAAAVAAGVALFALANRYGQLGAQIRDTAAGLDVGTDTLQALNYQFIQTGGGAETFSTAMRGLTSFMRVAAQGGTEQVSILRDLGMSYEQLANMRPEDQFYAITEALSAMTNGQKQAEAASAMFGSRYSQRVLGTLRQTEGTLQEAAAAFADADLGISEQDVKTLAEFSDKMTLMKQQTDAMMAEALLPVIDVLGRVVDNFEPVITIVGGFTTAIILNSSIVDKWGTNIARATGRLTALAGSLKTGVLGTMGLGAAIAFTSGRLFALYDAMHDAHEANLGLSDSLTATADLLQSAVATGFMTNEEAAASMDEAFRQLIDDATLGAGEFIALNRVFETLQSTLSTTTLNADLYTASLAGVSKGSYEAAIAQAQLQRAFVSGIFGADAGAVSQMDGVIASLQSMRDEAIRSGVELDKAFASTAGDGKIESGIGGGLSGDMEKAVGAADLFKQALLDIKAKMMELSTISLKDMLKVPPDVEKSMTGAALKMEAIKADSLQDQMAMQQALNNEMLSGAQQLGKIMLSGADDWEEQMLAAIIRMGIEMGLNMVLPGLGSFVSAILPFRFGGTVRGAQMGTQVPDTGPYGDRHLYALERGEVVIPRQEVYQGGNTSRSSTVNLSVSMPSMISTGSKTDLLRAADVIVRALRERGVSVG